MKKLRRIISWMLTFVMVLGVCQVPFAVSASTRTADTCIKELISYYKNYQDKAATDIDRVLNELNTIDEAAAKAWGNIMDYWSDVNSDGFVNIDTVPEGLPTDDSVAIVILGFALNSDGTMKDELIGRLQTGLNIANAYENAYVVVTGGGTAANNPDVTEGGLMGEWLLEQGLDEGRLIVENRAPDTVGNAKYTYEILKTEYPQVESVVLVTSDYHVPRGCILYYSKFVLDALSTGQEPLTIVSNGGYGTGSNGYETISLQASGVCSVAGISSSSLPSVTLSVLDSLTVTQENAYAAGEELNLKVMANYDSGYSKDVSEMAVVTGFDASAGAEQTVTVSYTENGVTVTGEFALNETEKDIVDYVSKINLLLEKVNENSGNVYTAETLEILDTAVAYAEEVLAKEDAKEAELKSAYETLEKAMGALVVAENIALKKSVIASHNNAEASYITDGSKSSYWSSYENGNIPIAESWFTIDLAGVYAIDAITAVPYFGGNERYYHYDISVSTDNETWTKVAEQRSNDDTLEAGATFVLDEAVEARYVRVDGVAVSVVDRSDITNFHMTEMMVYGNLVQALEEEPTKVLENVALYGKVTVDSGSYAYRINDGTITNSYWGSTNGIDAAYCTIELPWETEVEEFKVVTYYNNMSKWYTYEVLVSTDNETWTSVGKYEEESNIGSAGYTITLDEPVKARYVKVKGLTTNNTNMHLVEVQVFGVLDNIAEGKSTTASHLRSDAAQYAVANIVDGSLGTSAYWDTGDVVASVDAWTTTAEADLPYAVIDLEAKYEVDTINVTNYYRAGRYYQYRIYTSLDGETYTLFGEKTDNVEACYTTSTSAPEPVEARYIKIVGTYHSANRGYHLSEVRVLGTLVPEGPADYSAVEAAKAKVPEDLSIYTPETVVDLKIALAAVKEGLTESAQDEVDAMAQAIEAALAALAEIPVEKVYVELVTQPVDVTVEKGSDAVVSFEAIGDGLTYTWYYKNPGNVKFYVSGASYVNGNTYTIPMYAWRDGQQVYCVVTDAYGNSVKTNTVTLSMKKADIEIVTQPVDVVVGAYGEVATISVEAVGEGLTYTWYYKNPGNVKFYKSGEQFVNGSVYEIPVYSWRDGQQVYCVITNAAGESVQTNTVTLQLAEK